jgi:DNA-binding transcriptional LysR family regulator
MDVNFELYKVFYLVASHESFSAAARHLFISQSAVSQSIKNLERITGSQLFIRGQKSVKLTPAGRMLYSHVEQAYNLLKSAEDKILEMQQLQMGEIRIGVGDTLLKCLLLPYLRRFISEHPNVKVGIINRTSPGIIEAVKSNMVDFGIVTLPVEDVMISTREFRTVEDVFVASSRFGWLKGKPVSAKELAELPLLLLQKQSSTRRNLDAYFASMGLDVTPEIELESTDLLVELSRIGLGIAHVLKESAAELIRGGELFVIEVTDPPPPRKLGIAALKNVPLSPAADKFITMFQTTSETE